MIATASSEPVSVSMRKVRGMVGEVLNWIDGAKLFAPPSLSFATKDGREKRL